MTRYRSKTCACWLAVLGGAFGAHRFYLQGPRDAWAWLHPPPALAGLYGVWRMRTLGQDDGAATLLIPMLGLMITLGMLNAIVIGLTSDEIWDGRHNPGQPTRTTRWLPVLGVIAALMLGGGVLMGTIAFSGQRFFEWQQHAAHAAAAATAPSG